MKKPIYKRKWFIVLMVLIVLYLIGSMGGDNKKEENKTDQQAAQTEETKVEEKQEKEELNFAEMEVTNENAQKIADQIITSGESKATVEDGQDITVVFRNSGYWDEDHMVRTASTTAVDLGELYFKNEKTNSLFVLSEIEMIDEKGAESLETPIQIKLTRESIEGVNWENMKTMVAVDYNKIEGIAESVGIAPGIRKNLKD